MAATPAPLATPAFRAARWTRTRTPHERFERFYAEHDRVLYAYCRSILRHDEDARDALQNAVVKAFSALDAQPRDLDLRPWMFRIAHNEAISLLRRRRPTEDLAAADRIALDSLDRTVEDRSELRLLQRDLAVAPACTPQVTLRRALDALQLAARRPLPARGGRRTRAVRLLPCESGRVRVEIRTAGSDVLLARDDLELRAGVPARVRVQTTRAVRRYAGRGPIRLMLRARLTRVR